MSNIRWLCRVPLTIKLAKELVSTLPESEFVESRIDGYSYVEKEVTYGGIKQRWLVVQSKARRKSDLDKLSKKLLKHQKKSKEN